MRGCWFALLALAGCSQILGVKDITLSDAGSGSAGPDAMQHCVMANTTTPVGSKLFVACFDKLPTGPITLSGTIDTDTSGMCVKGTQPNSGPDVCMIAGTTLMVNSPLGAKGSRPLVLVALTDLTVNAQIDIRGDQVSSGMPVQAPGANTGCTAPSPGGDSGSSPGGGGGGAFGGASGAGGAGNPTAPAPGTAGSGGSTSALTFIHGGCDGAAGGSLTSGAGTAGGAAGTGGGALYMIAGNSIEVSSGATILAGGGGGYGGLTSGSSGGGGGTGGLVGFDSPFVGLDGTIIANGGGGGGGGGASMGADGETGTFGAATGGSPGSPNSGRGGDGGVGPATATSGGTPSGSGTGAGGGGGSIGVIWDDATNSTINGSGVSPDPIGP